MVWDIAIGEQSGLHSEDLLPQTVLLGKTKRYGTLIQMLFLYSLYLIWINIKQKSLANARLFVIPSGFEPETYCLEGSCSIQLSYWTKKISSKVGVAGFEPATSWSQTRRDNRATLHPEEAERQGLEPWRRLPVDRLAICSVTTPAPLLTFVY